jgi:hypothetical protein
MAKVKKYSKYEDQQLAKAAGKGITQGEAETELGKLADEARTLDDSNRKGRFDLGSILHNVKYSGLPMAAAYSIDSKERDWKPAGQKSAFSNWYKVVFPNLSTQDISKLLSVYEVGSKLADLGKIRSGWDVPESHTREYGAIYNAQGPTKLGAAFKGAADIAKAEGRDKVTAADISQYRTDKQWKAPRETADTLSATKVAKQLTTEMVGLGNLVTTIEDRADVDGILADQGFNLSELDNLIERLTTLAQLAHKVEEETEEGTETAEEETAEELATG